MTIAWGIILPLGVFIARFVKVTVKGALWFRIHTVLQPVGFFVGIGGVVAILIGMILAGASHFTLPHEIGGAGVCILYFSNYSLWHWPLFKC